MEKEEGQISSKTLYILKNKKSLFDIFQNEAIVTSNVITMPKHRKRYLSDADVPIPEKARIRQQKEFTFQENTKNFRKEYDNLIMCITGKKL